MNASKAARKQPQGLRYPEGVYIIMRTELYSIVALGMRYVFCALALIIVFRAWRITVVDNRRARILRMLLPDVVGVGEFIVEGAAPGRRRGRYLIPREGVLGSSGGADIRVKHPDIRRKHAFFELREGGLLMRPLRGASLSLANGANARQLILRDGDSLMLGGLKLTLILFDALGARVREADAAEDIDEDEVVDVHDDEDERDLYIEFYEEENPWQDVPKEKKTRRP